MTNRRPPGAPPPPMEGYHYPGERAPAPARGQRPGRSAPRASSPVLLGLVYGGIGLLALAVGAVTFFVMALPTDVMRREIVAQVKSATGRDLTIGEVSFTVIPTLGVSASDVSLSAPPGMGGAPLLTAKSIDVGVHLLPLLSQEIVVDSLVLREPVFALHVDTQGRRSWDMAALSTLPVRLAQADNGGTLRDFSSGHELPQVAKSLPGPNELSLEDIRIEDGTIRYSDARSGADVSIAAINARAGLEATNSPFTAKGSFVWAQEQVDFDGVLTSPSELLTERPAKLALSMKGAPFALSYDGSVTLTDTVGAEGAVEGSASSLRALADWLGTELPPARGFREASIAGHLNATESTLRVSDARLGLDGATATGTLSVTTTGAKPYVAADMKVSGLNLANYIGSEAGSAAPQPTRRAAPPPQAAPEEPPQSIEDLLEDRSGPQVKGFTQRAGWSGEPLDLAPLGLVDADAKLAVTGLSFGAVHVDASQLNVALRDSVLKTTFEEVKLYEGRGKGFVTLDGSGAEAAFAADVQLSGIAAQPLLKDAAGIDWLAGSGNVTLAVSGRGASEAAIVRSLNGKSDVAVRDGALIGFNLGGAMRALSEGSIPDFDSSPSDKTDFSELTGSFVITDGIAKNDDLQLASPLFRATGAGTVDLPARSLDYVVRPKLVASVEGQDGEKGLPGLEIPVHISGSWEEPSFEPDIAGVINNPDAVEAVKEMGKGFKGKKAGEIVEDLLGKGEDGGPSKAEKLLEKLFGGE